MKQFARQSSPLALVPSGIEEGPQPAQEDRDENGEVQRGSLRDFFDGWLNSVSPAILQSSSEKNRPARLFPRLPTLTSTDLIRVNRATVRESRAHRHWPREVVETFLAADVIRRKR